MHPRTELLANVYFDFNIMSNKIFLRAEVGVWRPIEVALELNKSRLNSEWRDRTDLYIPIG
jgi:hypothetical protein